MKGSFNRNAALLLTAGVIVLPMVLPWNMATEILIYAIVAVAANLLLGYSGLLSFGQASFFGFGGYSAGYLLAHYHLPLILPLLVGALAGGFVAAVVGALCIRRTGIYFIMLTFAFNQMFYYLAYQLRTVTGGEDGMTGITRPAIHLPLLPEISLNSDLNFYILIAVIFAVCFAIMFRVVESPFGKIVIAARDNARRAASIGYNVQRAQILMFVISGTITGLAGAIYSMLYWIMPIDSIHWLNSGNIVFMVLIGGTSSPFGPVLGAAIFIWLQDLLSIFWARSLLLFGAVVVAVVLFLQGGVIELFRRAATYLQRRRALVAEAR